MTRRDHRLDAALARWQHAAGPYWPYVCAAPFLSAAGFTTSPKAVARPSHGVVDTVRSLRSDRCHAVFVDLPPRETLPATATLNEFGYFVVPVIQRWVAERAILDSQHLVENLVTASEVIRRPNPARGVVLILDGDRAGPLRLGDASAVPSGFDNRYGYPSCRFPPPSLLKRVGIDEVSWVSRGNINPDLEPYAATLIESGLAPTLRPLGSRRAQPGR